MWLAIFNLLSYKKYLIYIIASSNRDTQGEVSYETR